MHKPDCISVLAIRSLVVHRSGTLILDRFVQRELDRRYENAP